MWNIFHFDLPFYTPYFLIMLYAPGNAAARRLTFMESFSKLICPSASG